MIKNILISVVISLALSSQVAAGCTRYTCSKGQVTSTTRNGVTTYGCTEGGHLTAIYYPQGCPSTNT